MKKSKLKVGDFVIVYRYQKDMVFSFVPSMKEYIGKLCKVESIDITSESFEENRIRLKPINWRAREEDWNWSESVLKKLSKEEAFLELI